LNNVQNANVESLVAMDGIGEVMSASIVKGLVDMNGIIVLLLQHVEVEEVQEVTGPLVGFTFCLTGSMSRNRKEIAKDIEAAGGEIKSSVGAGLSYLVQADPSSESSKTKKAEKHGTEVISEEHLMELMV